MAAYTYGHLKDFNWVDEAAYGTIPAGALSWGGNIEEFSYNIDHQVEWHFIPGSRTAQEQTWGEYKAGFDVKYIARATSGAYEWQGQTDIEDLVTVPTFSMFNYPNPFNPSTTIAFSIPETGRVRVSVYNVKGEKIKDLLNTEMTRGNHRLVWDGKDTNNRNVASGIYFIKLESVGKTSIRKAMLMK